MDVRTENELKKEYLKTYREHVRRITRIEEEIKELREMRTSMAINNDGMPKTSKQTDLSGSFAAEEEMIEKLKEERTERIKAYKEVVRRIKMLKSEYEQDVLFYRYIRGLEWYEVAEKLHYSERWVHKIHGRALANFKLPKDWKKSS